MGKSDQYDESLSEGEFNVSDDRGKLLTPLIKEALEMNVSADVYIKHVGEYGRYQKFILFLLSLITIPMSYPAMIYTFIGHTPNRRQSKATEMINRSENSLTDIQFLCRHQRNDNNSSPLWIYENNRTTMTTEFGLPTCDETTNTALWVQHELTNCAFHIGWGIGIILFGYLSDKHGRKKILFTCSALTLLAVLTQSFVYNARLLTALQFLTGFLNSGPDLNALLLLVETTGRNYQVLAACILFLLRTISGVILTAKSYYILNWRILCIVCSAPYFFILTTLLCVPDSIHWLNIKGRRKEAETILCRAARMNRKTVPPLLSLKQRRVMGPGLTYLNLFTRKNTRLLRMLTIHNILWLNTGLCYYVISRQFTNNNRKSENEFYLNVLASISVEVPAILVIMCTLQKFGRRKVLFVASLVNGLLNTAAIFIPRTIQFAELLHLLMNLFTKCVCVVSFYSQYMWSAEIYPTDFRAQGMALNITMGKLGAVCASVLHMINKLHPSADHIILITTSVVAAILCCALPETTHKAEIKSKKESRKAEMY